MMSRYLDLADGSYAPIDRPNEGDDSIQWLLRYSEPTRGQRLHAAAILAAWDHLTGDDITTTDAVAKLRLIRRSRRAAQEAQG
jgi:hypothetical protein